MEQLTSIFNKCVDRIDENDIEMAEECIVGCVTLLKRRFTGRADRDRIRADFSLNRGLEKYERELNTISKLSDDALSSLIASSIDLTDDLAHVEFIFNKIKDASLSPQEAIKQASKARKTANIFMRIADILRPATKKKKKKKKAKKTSIIFTRLQKKFSF